MAEVWSHSGVWRLESGVTPESGVWNLWSLEGVWSLEPGVTPGVTGVWSPESGV